MISTVWTGNTARGIVDASPGVYEEIASFGTNDLTQTTLADARALDPKFEIFICGEHGGDVYTIGRLHEIGLTGVSMSPGKVYRSIIKAAQCQVTSPRMSVK